MLDDFMRRCVRNAARPEDIDVYIEQWHNSGSELPLHDFLGLSWAEYRSWAADKSVLPGIIASRRGEAQYTRNRLTETCGKPALAAAGA
jgi:hypothetical protein